MDATFFETAAEFREWLDRHHQSEKELIVGYYKVATGIPSMTWSESVDQALCYGWIDGIRRSIDDRSYSIRFTPRNPKSYWSAVNIAKLEALKEAGLMMPAGLALADQRSIERSRQYAYERETVALTPIYEAKLKENERAWDYFNRLAPSYKKTTVHWVMRAKRDETRLRRLEVLIASCEEEKKIPLLRKKGK